MKRLVYEKVSDHSVITRFEFDEEEHKYYVNGEEYPANTHVLRAAGIGNYDKIPWEIMEHAKERGKAVHKVIELYDAGMLDRNSIHREVMPYFRGYLAFDEKIKERPILRECALFSRAWRFATTVDQVRILNGRIGILEIKTGRNSLSFGEIQTAGQLIALQEQIRDRLIEGLGEPIEIDRYVLELSPELTLGFKLHGPFTETAEHTNIFKACVVVYNHKKKNGELKYE